MCPLSSSDCPPPLPRRRAASCGRPSKPIPRTRQRVAGDVLRRRAPTGRPRRRARAGGRRAACCSAASSRGGSSGPERLVVSKAISSQASATRSSRRSATRSTSCLLVGVERGGVERRPFRPGHRRASCTVGRSRASSPVRVCTVAEGCQAADSPKSPTVAIRSFACRRNGRRTARTWMAWPSSGYTLGDDVQEGSSRDATWAAVAGAVPSSSPSRWSWTRRRRRRGAAPRSRRRVLQAPLDDAWMRDIGPTFVIDERGAWARSTGCSTAGARRSGRAGASTRSIAATVAGDAGATGDLLAARQRGRRASTSTARARCW